MTSVPPPGWSPPPGSGTPPGPQGWTPPPGPGSPTQPGSGWTQGPGWYGPQGGPAGGPPGSPYPPTNEQKPGSSTRVVVIVVVSVIVAVVVILGIIGFLFASAFGSLGPLINQAELSQLSVGECFNGARAGPGPTVTFVFGVDVVDCSAPHTSELIASFDYPDAGTGSTTYPGDERMRTYSQDACSERFASYVGVSFAESTLEMTYAYPTEFVWLAEERSIQCVVHPPDGQATMTGSVRGSRR